MAKATTTTETTAQETAAEAVTTTETTAQETAAEAVTTTETAAQETAAEAVTTTETAAQETAAKATTTTETDGSAQPDPEEKRIAIALWSIEHNGESYGCGDEVALTEAEFDSLSKGGVLGGVIWKDLGLTD